MRSPPAETKTIIAAYERCLATGDGHGLVALRRAIEVSFALEEMPGESCQGYRATFCSYCDLPAADGVRTSTPTPSGMHAGGVVALLHLA